MRNQLLALAGFFAAVTAQSDDVSESFGLTVPNMIPIPEESPAGIAFAVLRITGLLENSEVSCILNDERFQLQPGFDNNERMLMTAAVLDREAQAQYHVYACCSVAYPNTATICTSVRLDLLDLNDNAPMFPRPSLDVTLSENAPMDSIIAQVQALDRDVGENARISYELDPPNNLPFSVDEHTGILRATGVLDRELVTSYSFAIVARDNGIHRRSGTTTVTVQIQDVNDNAPVFARSRYEMAVTCGVPAGYQIGTVDVRDQDSGQNGHVTFSFQESTQASNIFTLDATSGILVTAVPVTPDLVGQYSFHLVASDHGWPRRSSTVPVTVTVTCDSP